MRRKLKLLIVSAAGLIVFLMTTNPADISSILLVAPFILGFLIAFLTFDLIFEFMTKRRLAVGTSLLLAGLVVILAGLQSLGQLTPKDVAMLLLVFGITFFYLRRRARVTP
ncbi:MAG: hypothetical protein ACREGD_01500 [Candidatus Saccharimonadales bacterium]